MRTDAAYAWGRVMGHIDLQFWLPIAVGVVVLGLIYCVTRG